MDRKSKFIKSTQLNRKIGDFIRYKRRYLGITGAALGVLLNVSQQQVSRYENGITNITVAMLNDVLIILDTTWDEFLSYSKLCDS